MTARLCSYIVQIDNDTPNQHVVFLNNVYAENRLAAIEDCKQIFHFEKSLDVVCFRYEGT